MITKKEYEVIRQETLSYFKKSGIVLTENEKENIEIADFGLGRIREIGLEVVVYVNTERSCAKELVLLPRQTCPQHYHPPVNGELGKEETFRCRWGTVYLYVPGEKVDKAKAILPKGREKYFTVWHEVILNPGEQYTLPPNTPHWFQAGDDGAVVSEFSTQSTDENDIFLDPDIDRTPKVID